MGKYVKRTAKVLAPRRECDAEIRQMALHQKEGKKEEEEEGTDAIKKEVDDEFDDAPRTIGNTTVLSDVVESLKLEISKLKKEGSELRQTVRSLRFALAAAKYSRTDAIAKHQNFTLRQSAAVPMALPEQRRCDKDGSNLLPPHLQPQWYRNELTEATVFKRPCQPNEDHSYNIYCKYDRYGEGVHDRSTQTPEATYSNEDTQCSLPLIPHCVPSLPAFPCSTRLCNKSRCLIARAHEQYRLLGIGIDSISFTALSLGVSRRTVKSCIEKYGALYRSQADRIRSGEALPGGAKLPTCESSKTYIKLRNPGERKQPETLQM
ncbi:hypothetical protein AB6A40_000140 [Gnathostoma spinigerum]|uniref:Uncharacterized protein n=1 Tax=Gnathostoma spinigerum TaxID=75299 RepID=A0ABD6E2R0_9BILA